MYYNKEAERSVLGSILQNNECLEDVSAVLETGDFYKMEHSEVFQAIQALSFAKSAIDVVTVGTWLRDQQKLDEVGGHMFLMKLVDDVVSPARVMQHAHLVKKESIRREIWANAQDAMQMLQDGKDPDEIIKKHNLSVGFSETTKPYYHASKYLQDAVKRIEDYQHGRVTSIKTHLQALNKIFNGFEGGDLILLGARPSNGKSTLAGNILEFISQFYPCGLITLEDTAMSFAMRRLSQCSKIDSATFRREGAIKDWRQLSIAAGHLGNAHLYIDEKSFSIDEITRTIRAMVKYEGVKFVVIDYIGLIADERKVENRTQYIARISSEIKSLAKRYNISILLITQLSRETEKRKNGRPMLADMRDSGSLEQDADATLFIYRPELYGIEQDKEGKSLKGIAEIIVAKQRNGPIGSAFCQFNPEYGLFSDIDYTNYHAEFYAQ